MQLFVNTFDQFQKKYFAILWIKNQFSWSLIRWYYRHYAHVNCTLMIIFVEFYFLSEYLRAWFKGLTTPSCSLTLSSPFYLIFWQISGSVFLWNIFTSEKISFYPILPLEPNGLFDYLLCCSLILDFRGLLWKQFDQTNSVLIAYCMKKILKLPFMHLFDMFVQGYARKLFDFFVDILYFFLQRLKDFLNPFYTSLVSTLLYCLKLGNWQVFNNLLQKFWRLSFEFFFWELLVWAWCCWRIVKFQIFSNWQ